MVVFLGEPFTLLGHIIQNNNEPKTRIMDLKEIQSLIKFVAKSGVNEVKLEMKDIKISIRSGAKEKMIMQPAMPAQTTAVSPQVAEATTVEAANAKDDIATENTSNYLTITSPIIGTFYRKPSPDKPVFVNVGDEVTEDSIVCIVEAMKLFNEIESEVSGKIVKILVEDSSPVEFGQPLFLVDPS